MKTLIVEPLKPLSLSATPITGITVISRIRAFSLPQPTTIIGALGAALGIELESIDPLGGISELVSKIRKYLRCGESIIKGPLAYFEVEGRIIGPTIPLYNYEFVKPECIKRDGEEYYLESESEECRERIGYSTFINTGVSLGRRDSTGEKTVKPGFMYRYPLGIYTYISEKEEYTARPIFVYSLNCVENVEKTVVRLGGEGGLAEIYASDRELAKGVDLLKTPLDTITPGVYISVNHIPLLPIDDKTLSLDKVLGLELLGGFKSVIGIPHGKSGLPKIVVERLGLGYYEVARIRRPQILALPPGTILSVENKEIMQKADTVELLKTLYSIGYATLYPLTS